ncbi:MAG: efflux RND transporter permease subunit [Thermodesulfobacteriota bacterium]
MDPIRFSIQNPVTVLVGVILAFLFGAIGLLRMPYQLSPTVTEPEITVTTTWTGATPYEVERDIIEEQEKVLKGIPGLVEMESSSESGRGQVTLRFAVGADVDNALLRVSNKMNEVPSYPRTADRPVISATGSSTNPVIWMVLKTREGNARHIDTYRTFFEDEVRQYLERVPGVADLFIGGGAEREMHVVVDPARLAAVDMTLSQLTAALDTANVNVSAGEMDLGRRSWRIRSVAEFKSPQDIEDVVLRADGDRLVRLRDVGHAEFGYARKVAAMMHNRDPGMAIGVRPEPGANILDLTDRVNAAADSLNEGVLKDHGVFLDWVYDQRPYINGAIDLVQRNIMIGGLLAVGVLLLFLRSLSATVVVGAAIPISVVGTFFFMDLFGRNLNVVSLAGISFAVGMLVDNAIVVLENIDRHRRSLGKRPLLAAYDGAREVWGAVLASTLTTVAVFLPVVFIEEEAGQLFKDISIAVTCAVMLSLLVSVSVIPMFSRTLMRLEARRALRVGALRDLGLAVGRLGGRMADVLMALLGRAIATPASRLCTVALLTGFAALATWVFFPKMEYLPQGNRNLVLNILIPPPGLSVAEYEANGRAVFDQLAPFYAGKQPPGLPGIRNCFYVGHPQFNIFGVIADDEQRAGELVPALTGVCNSLPGVFGVSIQAGIFQTRLGEGRSINVDLSGDSVEQLVAAGGAFYGAISQAVPGARIRPAPSLELTFPEVRILPDRERVRAAGLTAEDVGLAMDVFMDGRKVGEFKEEGKKKIDLVLTAARADVNTPEDLHAALLHSPGGRSIPVASVAELTRTSGVTSIRHLERRRTITLQVTPPEAVPLQQAMETISGPVADQIRGMGLLSGVTMRLSGAADKLTATRRVMQWDFLLAVVITYLLMSALFGNFAYPFIILFTVPLAGAGGLIGLKLQNVFLVNQPLDVVTMLGFIILVGTVVNNAILIVHQSLNNVRLGGMERREAVLESVRTRLRPIYMSATTSVFGMLPLAVAPGPGSELYRGLGSVILGGLALSTVFTVFVIPSLLMFFIGMEKPGSAGMEKPGSAGMEKPGSGVNGDGDADPFGEARA